MAGKIGQISMDQAVISELLKTEADITKDEKKVIKKSVDFYKKWAETYDKDCEEHGYKAHVWARKLVEDYVNDKNAYILSVGGGTGLDGQALYDDGYKNLDGHDGSQEMLDVAASRGIFKKLYCEMLEPNKQSKFPSDTYDVTVNTGCYVPNHMHNGHFDDLLRPLKKGGLSIIGTREMFVSPTENWDYNLDDKVKESVAAGACELLERRVVADYYPGITGVFYVLRKK